MPPNIGDAETLLFGDDNESSYTLRNGEVFGQYEIVRPLGRGGMGEVYEAVHKVLRQRYALKLIKPEILDREGVRQRFEREAMIMARLKHPRIVLVDEFGETDGLAWLRMEYVPGLEQDGGRYASLADWMEARGSFPPEETARLLRQILDGLAFAHGLGVVHRDIKPSNILLGPDGPKLTDFGLVRLVGEEWLRDQVKLTTTHAGGGDPADGKAGKSAKGTSTRAMLGTYEYMSPEQKSGRDADARSDLFAVGLIGFQLVTGKVALGMDPPSELVAGLNPAWDTWTRQAVRTDPEGRFADAAAMAQAVPGSPASGAAASASGPAPAVAGGSVSAGQTASAAPTPPLARRETERSPADTPAAAHPKAAAARTVVPERASASQPTPAYASRVPGSHSEEPSRKSAGNKQTVDEARRGSKSSVSRSLAIGCAVVLALGLLSLAGVAGIYLATSENPEWTGYDDGGGTAPNNWDDTAGWSDAGGKTQPDSGYGSAPNSPHSPSVVMPGSTDAYQNSGYQNLQPGEQVFSYFDYPAGDGTLERYYITNQRLVQQYQGHLSSIDLRAIETITPSYDPYTGYAIDIVDVNGDGFSIYAGQNPSAEVFLQHLVNALQLAGNTSYILENY